MKSGTVGTNRDTPPTRVSARTSFTVAIPKICGQLKTNDEKRFYVSPPVADKRERREKITFARNFGHRGVGGLSMAEIFVCRRENPSERRRPTGPPQRQQTTTTTTTTATTTGTARKGSGQSHTLLTTRSRAFNGVSRFASQKASNSERAPPGVIRAIDAEGSLHLLHGKVPEGVGL